MTARVTRSAWMALLLAAALAAGLLTLAVSASRPADAAPKFKFVTKTVNVPASIKIPGVGSVGPASPYPSAKTVGASVFPKGAKIVDVNLTLKGFGHDSPAEADFLLVHAGVNRTVMSDAGGIEEVGGLNITLDNQATATLPEGFNDPLTSGKFKPANYEGNGEGFDPPAPAPSGLASLAGFNGKNPEGTWRLFIDDQFNLGTGFLQNGYSLKIKAKFPTS